MKRTPWRAGSGAVLLCSALCHGQWSSNPAVNLAIANRPNAQVQPKIRVRPQGDCYVSWLDDAAGGYDLYLQRLSAAGVEQWAHNGVLVADTSFSSTTDYDMTLDGAGAALLTTRTDGTGAVQIGAFRYQENGVPTWGNEYSSGSAFKSNPRIASLTSGLIVLGWTNDNDIVFQRIEATGQPLGAPVTITDAGHPLVLSDLQATHDGNVIALWVRRAGPLITSSKHLYAQKFAPDLTPMWNGGAPVIVFDANSIQIGYFPTFIEDGSGGAVFAWYEIGGVRNCYIQHVDAGGVERFPHNGVAVSTDTSRIRLSPSLAYNPGTDEAFVAWTDANQQQSQWGVGAQKIAGAGARAWGEAGVTIVGLSASQTSFVRTLSDSTGGAEIAWFQATGALTGTVRGARLDAAGATAWPGGIINVCSVVSGKSRLDAAIGPDDMARYVWGDSRMDSGDIYGQNVRLDGTLGNPCYPDCDGSGTLNVNDYICFQTRFALGDPYADCDNNGARNVNDYICFQTRFALGC